MERFTMTVHCGCNHGNPHTFAMVREDGKVTIAGTGIKPHALTASEVSEALAYLADWTKRGGRIARLDVASV